MKKNGPYSCNLGSGLLVGISGRTGEEGSHNVYRFGPIFLAEIDVVRNSNYNFKTTFVGTSDHIFTTTLAQNTYTNKDIVPITWTFANSVTRTNMATWNHDSLKSFGGSVVHEASASLFGLGVKNSVSFEWTKSDTISSGGSESIESSLTWSLSGVLQPGHSVDAEAFCQLGMINHLPYTVDVKIILVSGSEIGYTEKGTFSNVVFALADAKASAPTSISSATAISSTSSAPASISSTFAA